MHYCTGLGDDTCRLLPSLSFDASHLSFLLLNFAQTSCIPHAAQYLPIPMTLRALECSIPTLLAAEHWLTACHISVKGYLV
jgi:hypothetical protein